MGADETVIDFEVTSNRADCFSIIGLAREAAITMHGKFTKPVVKVKEECFENNILDIDFMIVNNKFILECRCIRPFLQDELMNSIKYQKIIKRVQEFSSKLNLGYEVCFK